MPTYNKTYKNGKVYGKVMYNGKSYGKVIFEEGGTPPTAPKYRYIRDYLNGSTSNSFNHWVEIMAFENNINVAFNKTVSSSSGAIAQNLGRVTDNQYANPELLYEGGGGSDYVSIDLGDLYELDFLKIWHYYADSRTYHGTKTQVSADGVTWVTVFDSTVSGEYAETAQGHEIIL